MSDFETHDRHKMDLMREVVEAAVTLRQIDLMPMIERDARRKAEGLFDDAIRDYEEFEND